jgi:predicted AlkP superfamily phosphohydrolase/phosphomutase
MTVGAWRDRTDNLHLERSWKPRLLIIGIDSATFDLILPWIREGDLQNLARLISEGTSGTLRSTIPPNSPPAWTSFMTGKNPGKHGVFGFFEPVPNSYSVCHTNGGSRQAKTIWKILSESGKRVGIINVPMTYPPEEVAGYLIAGMDTPDERSQFIYPPTLQQELAREFGKIETIVYHFRQKLGKSYRSEYRAYKLWERLEERRARLCRHLIRTRPTDLVMVHFFAVDQIQHYFWHYMDPTHPLHDPEGVRLLGGVIKEIYRKIDGLVGELLALLPQQCSVIILSDHGAGPLSSRRIFINNFLASLGLLRFKDVERSATRVSSIVHLTLRRVDALLKRLLPSRVRTWLTWTFPEAKDKFESYIDTGHIDWNATKAFSNWDSGSSIWINMKGARPNGIVEPGAEYEELLAYITKKLYEIKDPETGEQMITRVYRKEEIYSGAYLHNAPDLLIDVNVDLAFQPGKSEAKHRGWPIITSERPSQKGVREKTGSHRYNGIMLLKGEPFKAGHTLDRAQIIDLAPTILYLMGLPVPDDMDGRVLTEALKDEYLARHPVTIRQADNGDSMSDRVYSDEDARKVEERLKSLGYLD